MAICTGSRGFIAIAASPHYHFFCFLSYILHYFVREFLPSLLDSRPRVFCGSQLNQGSLVVRWCRRLSRAILDSCFSSSSVLTAFRNLPRSRLPAVSTWKSCVIFGSRWRIAPFVVTPPAASIALSVPSRNFFTGLI